MINEQQFVATLAGLQELLPMGKTLSEPALVLAWALFPLQAKTELAPAHLLYAVQQRVLDPEPAREQAITQQLLRYLYPLADGMPALDRGLRSDLAQRMAAPERFHALTVPRPETTAVAELQAQRLLPPSSPQGAVDAICQVTRPLLLAARAAQETNPGEPSPFSEGQLALGAVLAAASLIGRCSLEALQRPDGEPDLAHEWIRTHPLGWQAMQNAARQEAVQASQASGAASTSPGQTSPGRSSRPVGSRSFQAMTDLLAA